MGSQGSKVFSSEQQRLLSANAQADLSLFCALWIGKQPGPSCSKLTTSLVNDSLEFTSSDTQIC